MVKDARRLDGSLNIDEETKMLYPNESRWDYAVSCDGKVYYVEVHPANTSNVEEVIKKKLCTGQIVYRSYLLYFICIHIFMN